MLLPKVLLTAMLLIGLIGTFIAMCEFRSGREKNAPQSKLLYGLLILLVLGGATAVAYACYMNGRKVLWEPAAGLASVATLLSAGLLYLRSRKGLAGISATGLPLVALLFAWSICPTSWQPFSHHPEGFVPFWKGFHLLTIFSGLLLSAVAAMAGGLLLALHHRLKSKLKANLLQKGGLNLESVELLMIRCATAGFCLLSLSLASGAILMFRSEIAWHGKLSAKVITALVAWLSYGMVMNLRYATLFRGRRAAWLTIAGFGLLLVVWALAQTGTGGMS